MGDVPTGGEDNNPTTETRPPPARAAGKRPRNRSSIIELTAGTSVGRFVVIEKLGKGGMGVVYAARDPVLDRRVAIKLWRPTYSSKDELTRARDRLQREAQALAQLSHPNIVAVHDFGEHGDGAFVAMELVEGKSLRQWVRAAPRTADEIMAVLRAAGAGLAAAHRIGIVHRDFKPDNVIVGDDGRARVLDFGLARATGALTSTGGGALTSTGGAGDRELSATTTPSATADSEEDHTPDTPGGGVFGHEALAQSRLASPLTLQGTVLGTPRYMSPEQHKGREADALADQFSFCVTAFQCLYGVHPFRAATVADLLPQIESGAVVPVALRGVPRRWKRALLRGLSWDKRDRFPSMDALLRELAYDPRAARRRLAWGGAAVALVGVAVAAWLRSPGTAAATCSGADARAAEAWNAGVAGKVATAIGKSGAPGAAALATRLDGALDDYARRWAIARTRACEDTRVRGDTSEQVLDLRMRCLDDRLDQLRDLAAIYAGPVDREAATRALEAAQQLGRLEGCDDIAALTAAVPPPADPAVRVRVDELEAKLRRAATDRKVGRYKDALDTARALVEPARAAGYAPTIARTLLEVGELESITGDSAAGEARLRQALQVAAGVVDDALLVDILGELIYVTGYEGAKYDEALALGAVLQPYAERRTVDAVTRGSALSQLGVVHWAKGEMSEAASLFRRALDLKESVLGKDSPALSAILDNLGNVTSDLKQQQAALDYYDRSLAITRKAYGADHPDVARTLLDRGTVLSDLGRYDEAIDSYRRAAAIWESVYGPTHSLIAAAENNLGDTLGKLGRWDESLAACLRALEIGDATLEPTHPIHAYHLVCVARAELALGRPADARPRCERAVELRAHADPAELAEAKELLARALWADAATRARARTTMAEARTLYSQGKDNEKEIAEIDQWVAKAPR